MFITVFVCCVVCAFMSVLCYAYMCVQVSVCLRAWCVSVCIVHDTPFCVCWLSCFPFRITTWTRSLIVIQIHSFIIMSGLG